MSPYIRFNQQKKLHRLALTLESLGHGFDGEPLFTGGNILLEAGSRLAVIGENGAGKTTLLRCLMNELPASHGTVKWAENATPGYCPQDSSINFNSGMSLFDWMSQWRRPGHDDQIVRATLGRLLFSSDGFQKTGQGMFRGGKEPAAVWQADDDGDQRTDHGRTDKPSRHGIH